MSAIYHLDYETYSPQPLGGQESVGAFRYASDPDAEILILTIRRNNEPVLAWSVADGLPVEGEPLHPALALFKEAIDSGAKIYAHNAQFEHAISTYLCQKTFGFAPPAVDQWRCTAAMARLAAIPSSLEECGAFLRISQPKDKEGKRLIDLFCKPRKATKKDPRTRVKWHEEPEEFQKFIRYGIRDVEAEDEVCQILEPSFPLEGWALESFQSDLRMNSRGIPVNRAALEHALALTEEFLERMVPLFRSQVASEEVHTLPPSKAAKARGEKGNKVSNAQGFNPTQRARMKIWLTDRGWTGDNLQAETVQDWLKNPRGLTAQAQVALKTYSMVASSAVKKVPAMLAMACEDGFVRGALKVFGAERTHRWTGKGMQPQNFARPRIKFTALAYDFICNGATLAEIESIFGNFFDVLVSVIRHFIQPHSGNCLQADYSSIEARVAPWLVGEQKTLDLFAAGEPIYELMASLIFGVPVSEVTSEQRFVGKQAVLGCSYNMGRPKFRGTCESYGFTPPAEMVKEYKPRHAGVVQLKFAAFKAEYSRKGCAMPAAINDEKLMDLMIKAEKWNTAGISAYDLKSGNLTDEQWVHLTYDDLADRAVTAWRANNPVIVQSWRSIDDAAKEAIENPGRVTSVGRLKFKYQTVANFKALVMKLPSGHKLIYPQAKVTKNTRLGWGTQIEFWGVLPNSGGKWGWCSTYGGKLLENATQATAGDVMRNGMQNAETAGYLGFMLVHDEILSSITSTTQTHEELCNLLCDPAPWMVGLPLAAEGGTLPFYKK